MKTSERFDKAIKALVDAFFNETLAKGSCSACAVGNMVAAAYGKEITCFDEPESCNGILHNEWRFLFMTNTDTNVQYKRWSGGSMDICRAEKLIIPTNYLEDELATIEWAFETNTNIKYDVYDAYSRQDIMEDQFKGLMAVVDVLCEIEGYDPAPYKKMFEYNNELQPVNL